MAVQAVADIDVHGQKLGRVGRILRTEIVSEVPGFLAEQVCVASFGLGWRLRIPCLGNHPLDIGGVATNHGQGNDTWNVVGVQGLGSLGQLGN